MTQTNKGTFFCSWVIFSSFHWDTFGSCHQSFMNCEWKISKCCHYDRVIVFIHPQKHKGIWHVPAVACLKYLWSRRNFRTFIALFILQKHFLFISITNKQKTEASLWNKQGFYFPVLELFWLGSIEALLARVTSLLRVVNGKLLSAYPHRNIKVSDTCQLSRAWYISGRWVNLGLSLFYLSLNRIFYLFPLLKKQTIQTCDSNQQGYFFSVLELCWLGSIEALLARVEN